VEFGNFEFRRISVKSGNFLEGVSREVLDGGVSLVAEPMRALMDLVYLRKLPWRGLEFLTDGLRIDQESLMSLVSTKIKPMLVVYKGKREYEFIHELLRAIGLDD
jgi:hypothetical protein